MTVLMYASKNGDTEIVKCLINAKGSPDMQEKASIIPFYTLFCLTAHNWMHFAHRP